VVPIPIPIVRPVRDIVFQGIAAYIQNGKSVHFAKFCREDLEFISVDVEDS
jgi:hypothetical protein